MMTTENRAILENGGRPSLNSNLDAAQMNNVNKSAMKIYFGLLFYAAVSFCEVFWKSSSNPVLLRAGYFFYPISCIIFFSLCLSHIGRNKLYLLCKKGHLGRIKLYLFLLTMLALYGLVRGNSVTLIVHELILLYSFALFLILGADEKVCQVMMEAMTIVFWAAFILSLLTFNIRGPGAVFLLAESEEQGYGLYGRYASSIAYEFFRPFIELALPLFIYGWKERTNKFHSLQVWSIVGYLIIEVAIFKFRGVLAFAAMVVMAALLMPSSIKQKMKLLFLTFIVILAASGWLLTKGGEIFTSRMKDFDKSNKVVQYRLPETLYYFHAMGYEWLWGRGVGGTFYGHITNKVDDPRNMREGVHIGWVTFTLVGGLPLLFIVLTFFAAGVRKNRRRMRNEPYYVVARLWRPICFVNWVVNPISLGASYVPIYGLTFLLLAQLGKRPVSDGKASDDSQIGINGADS